MKLIWLTDILFDFLSGRQQAVFLNHEMLFPSKL